MLQNLNETLRTQIEIKMATKTTVEDVVQLIGNFSLISKSLEHKHVYEGRMHRY